MEKFNFSLHRVTKVEIESKQMGEGTSKWIDISFTFADGSTESIAIFGDLSNVPPQLSFPRDSA